jgi:DNA-binding NarL/FixJ family response regulator
MSRIRVLIVEDEPLIAEHIATYLDNSDFEVSAISYDWDDAAAQLKHNTPDVVVLDINLEEEKDGIQLARLINEKYHLPFLFLTAHSDKNTLQKAKEVNPGGYIVKPYNERTIAASIEIALSNYYASANKKFPSITEHLINKNLPEAFSEREMDILKLVYEGISNNQIAAQLFISINTLKTHLKNIYLKLDVNNRYSVIVKVREMLSRNQVK